MATVIQDLIKGSLRLIGAVDPGQNMEAQDAADGLEALNQLLDALALEKLAMVGLEQKSIAATGAQSYTVGPSGDISMTKRPVRLENATWRDVPGKLDIPATLITEDDWLAIPVKGVAGAPMAAVFYDPQFPLGVLNVYPQPTSGTLLFSFWTQISQVSLNTAISFPQGMERFLRYALAVELAPEFGKPVDAWLVEQAREAKAKIKQANIQPLIIDLDPALCSGAAIDVKGAFLAGE